MTSLTHMRKDVLLSRTPIPNKLDTQGSSPEDRPSSWEMQSCEIRPESKRNMDAHDRSEVSHIVFKWGQHQYAKYTHFSKVPITLRHCRISPSRQGVHWFLLTLPLAFNLDWALKQWQQLSPLTQRIKSERSPCGDIAMINQEKPYEYPDFDKLKTSYSR